MPPLVFIVTNGGVICFFFLGIYPFLLVRFAYAFNTIVMPVLLTLSSIGIGIVWWQRREWTLLMPGLLKLGLALLLFGSRVYATSIEPNRLVVPRVTIRTAKVTQPLRILHISDIQAAAIDAHEVHAFEMMRQLNPDLIVHTGDLLQPIRPATYESELPKLAGLFHSLHLPAGLIGVYGDVDVPAHGRTTQDWGGLRLLESQSTKVRCGQVRINILGLSLRQSRVTSEARPFIEHWFRKTDPHEFTLVLGHAPDYVLVAQELPIDLCLAGHTHGGQIRIPFYGPLLTLSSVPREWSRGFRWVGKTRLNVSAGIGAEHVVDLPSIRINCPPEMTLIELQPDH